MSSEAPVFYALSLLALGTGAITAALGWSTRRRLAAVEATPTTSIGKIAKPGYYEIKGKIECDNPLLVPGTGEKCVYYHLKIVDVTNRSHEGLDGDWHVDRRQRGAENEESSCIFRIRDRTGAIGVLPTGATFDASEAYYHRDREGWGMGARLGAAVGFRVTERVGGTESAQAIPVGATVYAIGAVTQLRNGLHLQRDESEGRPYVISVRSEEELADNLRLWSIVQGSVAAICLLLALLSLLSALKR